MRCWYHACKTETRPWWEKDTPNPKPREGNGKPLGLKFSLDMTWARVKTAVMADYSGWMENDSIWIVWLRLCKCKKLQFIRMLNATSNTAKIIKKWYPPTHRLSVNVLLSNITFLLFLPDFGHKLYFQIALTSEVPSMWPVLVQFRSGRLERSWRKKKKMQDRRITVKT